MYLSMPLHEHGNSKDLLHPYLAAILDSNPTCQSIFQLFYMQYFPITQHQPLGDILSNFLVFPHLQPDTVQAADQAALDAENAFWSTIQVVDPHTNHDGVWFDDSVKSSNLQDLEY